MGVEVEIERRPPRAPQAADRVEPVAPPLRGAGRIDATAVYGVEFGGDPRGDEQEPAAEFGAERPRCQVERAHVGDIGGRGPDVRGSFLVEAARQPGEALLLQDARDGGRADRRVIPREGAADLVDRQVLLAEGDDTVSEPLLPTPGLDLVGRGDEERPLGVVAELMHEDPHASWSVPEPGRHLSRGQAVDEVGPQGFVPAMGGIRGLEEVTGER